MPYQISQNSDPYIRVTWSGVITPADIQISTIEVFGRTVEDGLDKVLVDVRSITNTLSTSDLFFTTEAQAKLGPPRPHAALLGRADQKPELEFIESVGVNRGMPLKSFTSEPEALAWLLS